MRHGLYERDSETRLSTVLRIAEILSMLLMLAVFFVCYRDISRIMRGNGENSLLIETDKKSAYIYGVFEDEWNTLERFGDDEIEHIAEAQGIGKALIGDMAPVFEGSRYAHIDDAGVTAAIRDENGTRAFVYDTDVFASEIFGRSTLLDEVLGVCDSSGNMLLSNDWAAEGSNIIEMIGEADEHNESAAAAVEKLLASGGHGFAHYTKFGSTWYCGVSPIGINDWYVLYRAEDVEYSYAGTYIARDLAAMFAFCLLLSMVTLCISRAEKKRSYEITAQKDRAMRASRECLRRLGERPGAMVLDIDAFTGKTYLYGSFMSKFGRDPILNDFPFAAARGGALSDDDAQKISHMMDRLRRGVDSMQSEITLQHDDGSGVACVCAMRSLKDENGLPYRIIAQVFDKGDEPAGNETDKTTGLPKGRTAMETMEKLLADGHCSLILCNIDITELDEAVGYDTRERLIARLAGIIKGAVSGEGFMARLGMDEFAILLSGKTDTSDVSETAASIRKAAESDPEISGAHLKMYLGTASTSRYVTSFDDLYFNADVNQYNTRQRSAGR